MSIPLTFNKLCVAVISQKTSSFDIAAKCGSKIHKSNECDPSAKGVEQTLARTAASLYCSPGKCNLNLKESIKSFLPDNAGRLSFIT